MTEKRFTDIEVDKYYGLICMNHDGRFHSYSEQGLEDLLNHLHEENIRLKRDFDSCSHNWALMYDEAKNKVEALTKENWELEQENEKLENRLWNCQNVR